MLQEGFQKIFWGWILVMIEIHFIAMDILPDPIGYLLIYFGLLLLMKEFPSGKKAKNLAVLLMVVSIPTIFIQNNQIGSGLIFSGWFFYTNILEIFILVLAYFIFQLLISVASEKGNQELVDRTNSTFKLYMVSMLVITFFQPFTMNLPKDLAELFIVVSAMYGIILQVLFLILIKRFSRYKDHPPSHGNLVGSMTPDESA
ncbi:hypothetical protein [Bacillus sp. FJAT-27251]|uniref:hypothetical protein n=1 Tax=Bacillus sp. FJAT-27251 TaxID=1684142 RepID=UPI0006A7EB92|nr:hypothetical protein [Bacillus sp. FJAT-27251]